MIRPIARILVPALLIAGLALAAQARPRIKRAFVAAYPRTQGTRLDACVTCHSADMPALNPYGAALRRGTSNFAMIERLDSDGDGFTNRKEIDALSFPGDAKDRPGARRDSVTVGRGGRRDSTAQDTSMARPDTLKQR
jgi:hypothetical protein